MTVITRLSEKKSVPTQLQELIGLLTMGKTYYRVLLIKSQFGLTHMMERLRCGLRLSRKSVADVMVAEHG